MISKSIYVHILMCRITDGPDGCLPPSGRVLTREDGNVVSLVLACLVDSGADQGTGGNSRIKSGQCILHLGHGEAAQLGWHKASTPDDEGSANAE
jgi:hypothetical protein